MKKISLLLASAAALLIAQGGRAAEIPMQFVMVGDPCNAADTHTVENTLHLGKVNYKYRISKYEVTNAQYCEFLNAVAKSDPHGLYAADIFGDIMGDPTYPNRGGIARSGSDGSYVYNTISGRENKPVIWVSWRSAARFANWMHNGKKADAATAEYGAYDASTFTGTGWNHADQTAHNADATYWIPTWNEWYKAAFYKGGSTNAGYWTYAVQTDTRPMAGPWDNGARCNYEADNWFSMWQPGAQGDVVDVNNYRDAVGPYGTYQQSGNASEWVEDWWPGLTGYSRPWVGGAWKHNGEYEISRDGAHTDYPETTKKDIGFRLAASAVPETCEEVQAAGLVLKGDLNGDCKIDFKDFAEMSTNWMVCNDPANGQCITNW